MIKTENVIINGREFAHTWSDRAVMIARDGILYDSAYDPIGTNRVYTEALDHPIEEPELTPEETLTILLGGEPV